MSDAMTDETEVWQDIATAPRDKDVLVFCPAGHCTKVFVAYLDGEGDWVTPDLKLVVNNSGDPSHWAALPPPPKEQSNER